MRTDGLKAVVSRLLVVAAFLTLFPAGPARAADMAAGTPIPAFTAVKLEPAPVMDGKVAPGEWDRAFTTAGMIAPFEKRLQTAETVMSVGYDAERFYFLFRCKRGNAEWRLMKSVRENDDYSYGDPSVEVWVTPPTLVPETYQSVINTYPAVMDGHQIPTRGYTAMGWKGNWKLGVDENPTDYVIEASIPIKDFGFPTVKDGDVWRFLLCRTCHGTTPRAQASWSITQGFNEIPQHPEVRLREDGVVVQLTGVTTLFTGKYSLPLAVLAPKGRAVKLEVEVRRHAGNVPGGADDVVEVKPLALKAGEKQTLTLTGEEAGGGKDKTANLTLTVREAGAKAGEEIFRATYPYNVNGWTQTAPARPEKDKLPDELAIYPMYGPETKTVIVKADIFDLPGREQIKSATVQVTDPETGKVLVDSPLSSFREWYASAVVKLPADLAIPVVDFAPRNKLREEFNAKWDAEQKAKEEANPITDKAVLAERAKIASGQIPPKNPRRPKAPLPPEPSKAVQVVVTVAGADGKPVKTATKDLSLLSYKADWMNNDVGVTDKVIPPWTPIARDGAKLKVWNRAYEFDGLGLLKSIDNGGVQQLESMRLIAEADGKPVVLAASAPTVKRLVEAEADLTGEVVGAGLKVSAQTRLEFDGFVRNTWTLAPAGAAPAKIDRLTLEIVLPESEATHFCVTAGGWTATHDELPARWDSRSTASGMLVGDWVPYIWLTCGDRAFQWFADSDRGWIHDADKKLPTQELDRKDGKVTLRVHFVEIPAEIAAARTFTWGYQTFPSRPLPPGFRAQFVANGPPVPDTTATFFWADADWSVLWPYYCGPFPWSMTTSKWFFDRVPKDSTHHPMVGSIAHSIGRYRDYEGNEFPALTVDWGASPGQLGNADVTASKGPNDFRLWHYRRWVREAGFRGLYVDENYLATEENFLTGNAWIMPDGKLQRAYNYLGLREYFKRLKIMFHQEGVSAPNLWQHISSGSAYNAWFGDILMEGENVEPTNERFDYIEVLPAGRMRAIGSPVTAGGMAMMMCQSLRHPTQWAAKHTHQFTGWVLAHDIMPEQVPIWPWLCAAGRMHEPGVQFLPYWKETTPFKTKAKDCVVSAHRSSARTIAWVVNISRQPAEVAVAVDWKALGLDPAELIAVDAEFGKPIKTTGKGFTVTVPERDYVPVLLLKRGTLEAAKGETLVASFDAEIAADHAIGLAAFKAPKTGAPERVPGKQGSGVKCAGGLEPYTWLNLDDSEGTITFDALIPDQAKGPVLSVGPLVDVVIRQDPADKKTMQLALLGKKDAKDSAPACASGAVPGPGWHQFAVRWKGGKATLAVDDATIGTIDVQPFGFGARVEERSANYGYRPDASAPVVIGRGAAAVGAIDNLRLARRAP